MKVLYIFHVTGFYALSDDDKKAEEIVIEQMICEILYLENSDKVRSSDLKKRIENEYVLNKAECARTVTAVQTLVLYYQPSYNYNNQYQFQGVSNQLMFSQCGKTVDDEVETKEDKHKPQRNLDHITCKYCGGKAHYAGNSECYTQKNLKEDAE